MTEDKKAESARVVGYICQGFAVLLLIGALLMMTRGSTGNGLVLLVIGLALLTVGIVTAGQGKRKSNPGP